MHELGNWFVTIIQPIISMLKVEGFGPFLALMILTVGIVVMLAAIIHFVGFSSKLKRAIGAVGDTETEEAFYQRYEELDQFFKSEKNLGACWREFTETVIHPHVARPGGTQPIIRNTSRPTDFFIANFFVL